MLLKTFEVFSPLIQLFMLVRNHIELVGLHQRMRTAFGAIDIKLFFKQSVYRGIEREWEARRHCHTQTPVEIKAFWAIEEELDFRSGELEGIFTFRIVEISYPIWTIIFGHNDLKGFYRRIGQKHFPVSYLLYLHSKHLMMIFLFHRIFPHLQIISF